MEWKKLPTWIKGGVIGGLIFLIYGIIVAVIFYSGGDCSDMGCMTDWLIGLPSSPMSWFVVFFIYGAIGEILQGLTNITLNSGEFVRIILGIVSGVIQYFLVGSLIGLIIQKIKQKIKSKKLIIKK